MMSKSKILGMLVFLIMFYVVNPYSSAQDPLEVKIVADKEVIRPVDYATYTVYVTNNLNRKVATDIFVWSTKTSWFLVDPASLVIDPGETKTAKIYVLPKKGTPEGLYTFQVEVRDKQNPEIRVVKKDSIYVLKSLIVRIKKLTLDRQLYSPGDEVNIGVGVKNEGSDDTFGMTIWLEVSVNGVDGNRTKRMKVPQLDVDEAKMLYLNFTFDKYESRGKYKVVAKVMNDIGEVLDEKEVSFMIKEVVLLDKRKNIETKFLERIVTIEGTNIGNVEGVLTIREPKSLPMLVYEFDNIPEMIRENGRTYFLWKCELKPLEKCVVSYRINYWPLVFAVLGALIIIGIVFEILQYPRMHKRVYRRGEEHKVLIRIKNRGRRTLKNVEIVDDVPGMFQVIRDFEAGKPVSVKKMKGKTRIVWRFPQLKPGEEKLLVYRIKPLLDVEGGIKLPPVEISGRVGRRRIRTRTGEIEIK